MGGRGRGTGTALAGRGRGRGAAAARLGDSVRLQGSSTTAGELSNSASIRVIMLFVFSKFFSNLKIQISDGWVGLFSLFNNSKKQS